MRDVIGIFLRSIRVNNADFMFLDLPDDIKVEIHPKNQIIIHVILQGRPALHSQSLLEEHETDIGDIIITFHDALHTIGNPAAKQVIHLDFLNDDHMSDVPRTMKYGSDATSIQTLVGALQMDPACRPFLDIMPQVLFLNSQARRDAFDHSRGQALRRQATTPGGTVFLTKLAELYLLETIRLSAGSIRTLDESDANIRSLARIVTAIQLMLNARERKWSVSSLARHANMSRSAFAEAFHRAVGKPPLQFLTELRMTRAAELLTLESGLTKEVGFQVGYESAIAFARAFRRHFGMSPTEYVRAHSLHG